MELCFQQPTIALGIFDAACRDTVFGEWELPQLRDLIDAGVIDEYVYAYWQQRRLKQLKRHTSLPAHNWNNKRIRVAFALVLGWCLRRQIYEPVILFSRTCLSAQWLLQQMTLFHFSGKCGFGHTVTDFVLCWTNMGAVVKSDHECERHHALTTVAESYWRPAVHLNDFQLNACQSVYFGSGFIDKEKLLWFGWAHHYLQIVIKDRPERPVKRIKITE